MSIAHTGIIGAITNLWRVHVLGLRPLGRGVWFKLRLGPGYQAPKPPKPEPDDT